MFSVFLISLVLLFTPHGATIKDNLKVLESFSSSFRPTMRADLKANVALPDDIASSSIGTYVRGELNILDDDTFYEEITTDEAVQLLRSIINGSPHNESRKHDEENKESGSVEENDYNNQDQTDGDSQSEESNDSIPSQDEEEKFDLNLLQVESVEYFTEVTTSDEEGDGSQNQDSSSEDVITQTKEYTGAILSESFNQDQDLLANTSSSSSDNSNTVQSSNSSSYDDSKKENLGNSDLGNDEGSKNFLQH